MKLTLLSIVRDLNNNLLMYLF